MFRYTLSEDIYVTAGQLVGATATFLFYDSMRHTQTHSHKNICNNFQFRELLFSFLSHKLNLKVGS